MLRIRKQRESASSSETAYAGARTCSFSTGADAFAHGGAGSPGVAASLEGALCNWRLAGQEVSTVFQNRQALI